MIDIDEQIRDALREQVDKLNKHLNGKHKWSARERIRFMKCLDQLVETNGVLDRATAGSNGNGNGKGTK
jgi:aromatic ring hydroxylase